EADVSNNEGRRTYRGTRRLLRRRKHRIDRVKQLLIEYKIINSVNDVVNNSQETPYHIREKGLSQKLSKHELALALLHLCKRRGIHNIEVAEEDESQDNELSTKEQVRQNQ